MASLEPYGNALVFIGFMGAGKSTAAAEVAAVLGTPPHETDDMVEVAVGRSIAEEIDDRGEEKFRELEESIGYQLLAGGRRDEVYALGGGSVLLQSVWCSLGHHIVVLLDVDPELAWERVSADGGAERPLARDRESFLALYAERRPVYEELADAILPAHVPNVAMRALPALRALQALRADHGISDARLLWASSASGEYPVLVGRGLLRPDVLCAPGVWPLDRGSSAPFCVSDQTVAPLYAERLGGVRELIEIPPGERSKTLASAETVWSGLAIAGMTRADHLVALGGGVVGDLAGFCAATYQRGVPLVQVPTTLVAQVDSAYGGKTGVDLAEAKNYVGVYHQPAGVLVDPDVLETLPAEELAAGWVEVLKTALIAGGGLWERVAAGGEVDEETILACARTKLAVVAEDERDAGRRQVLNLGHTVGHAIETATGYARYRHGEAVGLGLLAALRLSGQDDLRSQVRELLRARGLPVTLADATVDVEQIVQATARDKKRVGAHVPFVLVDAPGEVITGREVSEPDLRAAVAELF